MFWNEVADMEKDFGNISDEHWFCVQMLLLQKSEAG